MTTTFQPVIRQYSVELRVRFGFNCFAREKKNGNTRNSRAVPLSDQMRVLVVGDECARPHFVAKNPVITDLQPEPAINRETWSKVLAVFLLVPRFLSPWMLCDAMVRRADEAERKGEVYWQ